MRTFRGEKNLTMAKVQAKSFDFNFSSRSYLCYFTPNHKKYNSLNCDWFKKLLFSTNSLAKLLSDSSLLDSLSLDRSISQSHPTL